MDEIKYKPIGIIHSQFREAKGTPTQATAAKGINGTVEVFPEYTEGFKMFYTTFNNNGHITTLPFTLDSALPKIGMSVNHRPECFTPLRIRDIGGRF